jgi:integrase
MSGRRATAVVIWEMQDRRAQKANKPWVVRWRVGRRQYSKAFITKAQAERFDARLRVAADDGETFDPATGQPMQWAGSELTVATWAQTWLAEGQRWKTWTPRTRRGHIEAITRWTRALVRPSAPAMPDHLRTQLPLWLRPDRDGDFRELEVWLRRWSYQLNELSKSDVQAAVNLLGMKGRNLDEVAAPDTASRMRRTARVHFNAAVRLDLVADLWPPRPPQTKRTRRNKNPKVDRGRLPSPQQAVSALDAIRSKQPASAGYRALTACVYYVGMRPSEAVALQVEVLELPESGWGAAFVSAALQDQFNAWGNPNEEIGDTKTGVDRTVPLPPALVAILREYIGERNSGPLVSTRNGNLPTYSNWTRSWKRARNAVGGNWRLYDLRHACATTMLDAGLPHGEVAERLGHSVETLVANYIHPSQGDTDRSNRLLEERWLGSEC